MQLACLQTWMSQQQLKSLGPAENEWWKVTDSKYQLLENMKLLDLVEPPANVNIVGCKLVFKIKRNSDNTIDHFKVHLLDAIQHHSSFIFSSNYSRFWTSPNGCYYCFFNSNLNKDIYIKQAEGYIVIQKDLRFEASSSLMEYHFWFIFEATGY